MATGQIAFVVPADAARIAEILNDSCSTSDDIDISGDYDAIAASLAQAAGSTIAVKFEEDAPGEPIFDIAAALNPSEGRYMATFEAYHELSRGMLMRGRVLLNRSGEKFSMVEGFLPSTYQSPGINTATLIAAGFKKDAEAIVTEFASTTATAPCPR